MYEEPTLTVSPHASASLKLVGEEKTPVIVIDNYAHDCEPVLRHAYAQSYHFDEAGYYPGVRARLPKSYAFTLLKPIYNKLVEVYSVPKQLQFSPRVGYYSLISQSASSLSLLQRIPHFDSNNPYYFAILHYLNPGCFGGTAFFKHKATGYERVTQERVSEYMQMTTDFFERNGEPEQRYITESSSLYELCDKVEYKPNRLVVYPGSLLHSGLIDPQVDINSDPRTGRLTANIFVEFQ